MPTYEYACTGCGHQWETFQSIKDDAIKVCPNCGEEKAKRMVTGGAGFILKGGGWYSDLYASAKPGKGDGDAKQSSSDSAATSSGDGSSGASSSGASSDGGGGAKTSSAAGGSSSPSSGSSD